MDSTHPSPLCSLCKQFTNDLPKFKSFNTEDLPEGWKKGVFAMYSVFHQDDAFQHHISLYALQDSAASCTLCSLLLASFSGKDVPTSSPLHLFPWSLETTFIASFDTFKHVPREPVVPEKPSQEHLEQMFQYGKHQAWASAADNHTLRAIPANGWDTDVFETARHWLTQCSKNHKVSCGRLGNKSTRLPTRVIDVGSSDGLATVPRLIVNPQFSAPYAALSHCWGGNIDFRLTKETLADNCIAMPLDIIPRNFCDAILMTRKLGIRYLWIDALCIIQDSGEDWAHEASLMMPYYQGSLVTICALDSPSSNAGILHEGRGQHVVLEDGIHIIQKAPRELQHAIASSQLSCRGWCLQERLVAPRILHVGLLQIHWECTQTQASENGAPGLDSRRWQHGRFTDKLMKLKRDLREKAIQDGLAHMDCWHAVVEDYTTRQLTYDSDVFPALAGAAELTRSSSNRALTYAAGLWVEHMDEGLLWGPKIKQEIGRKAPGFSFCEELQRCAVRRAPSWSWASVKGPIGFDFNSHGSKAKRWEILDVTMDSDMNNLTPDGAVQGMVRIRGLLAPMLYVPPVDPRLSVGNIQLRDHQDYNFDNCVLDVGRREPQECYGVLVSWTVGQSAGYTTMLVLRKAPEKDNSYIRIGICVSYYRKADYEERFEPTLLELV